MGLPAEIFLSSEHLLMEAAFLWNQAEEEYCPLCQCWNTFKETHSKMEYVEYIQWTSSLRRPDM